jgi:membrane fusion protein (multidrug efflux system)
MNKLTLQILALTLWTPMAGGQSIVEYPGYADAVRRGEIASAESGVIVEVMVRDGEWVEAGQPLVRLDADVYASNLAAAQHEAQNTADLRVAQARVRLLEQTVAKLRELVASGNARPIEMEREEAELEIARATVELRRHEYLTRQHQVERQRVALEKRTIVAPFSGHIAKIHRQVGEYVSLQSPVVVTLVDGSELQAEFAIPLAGSQRFAPGQTVQLRAAERTCEATIQRVGLLVDRSSQTVTLQVRFGNPTLDIKPGTDCVVRVPPLGSPVGADAGKSLP